MHTFRHLVPVLALVSIAATPIQTAKAAVEGGNGSSAKISFRIHKTTIPWGFITPEGMTSACPEIPAGVVINPDEKASNRDQQATIEDRPEGGKRIVLVDTIVGTAHDNEKNVYRFNYYNKQSIDWDGQTATVRMQDTFRLRGGKVNMFVAFDWQWAYATTAISVSVGAQSIVIDPAPFAVSAWPVSSTDQLKEDSHIIPGSLKQLSIVGAPYACDPL